MTTNACFESAELALGLKQTDSSVEATGANADRVGNLWRFGPRRLDREMSILERAGKWILHVLQPAEWDRVGAITQEEAEAWVADLHEAAERGAYFFSLNRYLFIAGKPAGR